MTPHSPSHGTVHRREFLKLGAATGASLALGSLGQAQTLPRATARQCIFIMLTGGPSQLDTWDPKPNAPQDVRGPFRPISTAVPGMQFTELFPRLASQAQRLALIRSLHHREAPIHENGYQMLNTGHLFRDEPERPHFSVVVQEAWQRAGVASPSPVLLPHDQVNTGVSVSHGQGSAGFSTATQSTAQVLGTTNGVEQIRRAADAIEQGHRLLTINMFSTVFDQVSWDCHADGGALSTSLHDYRDRVAPAFDVAFSQLLTNLSERGLLDSTLVVAVGEFGRTPRLNANGGRDHWPSCWTALLAGGGVQGGRIIGASDATANEPADRPVTPPELVATICHALGVPAVLPVPDAAGLVAPLCPAPAIHELF